MRIWTINGAATYVIKSICPTIVEAQEWYCEEEEEYYVFTKQAFYTDGTKTTTT